MDVRPLTIEGCDMLDHSVQYHPADADKAVIGSKIRAIEAEAADRELRVERVRIAAEVTSLFRREFPNLLAEPPNDGFIAGVLADVIAIVSPPAPKVPVSEHIHPGDFNPNCALCVGHYVR